MKNNIGDEKAPRAGNQLRRAVRFAWFGLLFFSPLGTGIVWAGTDSFRCPEVIWKTPLTLGLFLSSLAWIVYLPSGIRINYVEMAYYRFSFFFAYFGCLDSLDFTSTSCLPQLIFGCASQHLSALPHP
jgi:hypothetical protein